MTQTRKVSWFVLSMLALALVSGQLCAGSRQSEEERLGKEYASEIERDVKLVTDAAVLERVQRVGQRLAEIANTVSVPASYGSADICQFQYQFKVIEDKDVNAFSLPGGRIYVNSGLLDLVESDDELAGVLAHEISHASHHHMLHLIKKSSSADRYVALVALAGILGNVRSRDLSHLLLGAQMMKIGKLSSYTQEAEKDADRTAVAYMVRAKFNPEGMLTFMRKLEAKHDETPSLPLGIFQTHPAPFRRVASIAKAMREEGLQPNLRRLQDIAYARSVEVEGSSEQYQVVLGNRVLYTPAGLGGGPCSRERADQIATRINKVIDDGVRPCDITQDPSTGSLLAGGTQILKVEKEDIAIHPKGEAAILLEARSALEYALWADWLQNNCVKSEEEGD